MSKKQLKADLEQQVVINLQLTFEIDKLSIQNHNYKERVEELEKSRQNAYNALSFVNRLLRRIMAQLALFTILEHTHRERNEQSRSIILSIDNYMNRHTSSFANIRSDFEDTEDIPF